MKRRTIAVSIAVIAALLVLGLLSQTIGQWKVPAYAKPPVVAKLFETQLNILRKAAQTGEKASAEDSKLFDPAYIHGAFGVIGYHTLVKDYSPEYLSATKVVWRLFPAHAKLGQPAVNILKGRFAVYEERFRTTDGKEKGCELVIDTDYLKEQSGN